MRSAGSQECIWQCYIHLPEEISQKKGPKVSWAIVCYCLSRSSRESVKPAKFIFFQTRRTSLSMSVYNSANSVNVGFQQFYDRKLAEELKMINTSGRAVQLFDIISWNYKEINLILVLEIKIFLCSNICCRSTKQLYSIFTLCQIFFFVSFELCAAKSIY